MNIPSLKSHGHSVIHWLICVFVVISAVIVKVPNARAANNLFFAPPSDQSDLVGDVVQTGRNDNGDEVRGAMVFRVRAFVDNGSGNNRDGDGIRNVDMIILDQNGRQVVRRRENSAGYCAFSGGEPNCNVYVFADHNNRWPNGDKIRRGEEYTLRAIVTANDGRQTVIERTVVIR